jgi:PAS domain S-box-containing protein
VTEQSAIAEAAEPSRWDAEGLRARYEQLASELENERRIVRQILECVPIPCVLTDPGGAIVDANSLFADFVGTGAEFLLGKPLVVFVDAGSRRAFRNLIVALRDGGSGTQLDVPLAGRHGARGDVRLTALPAPADPSYSRVVWLLEPTDGSTSMRIGRLDELVRARTTRLETAVERKEDEVRMLEEAIRRLPIAAAILGVRGGPLVTTSAFDALVGSEDELASARSPDGHAVAREDLPLHRSLTRGETVSDGRLTLERDHGRLLRLECSSEPVRSPNGQVAGAIAVVVDLDADGRRLSQERDFLAAAAHQLQNPLTAIATAVEVLQGGAKNVPDERDRFLEHIEQSATRLTRIVRSLLVLLRQRANVEKPRRVIVAVRPLLNAIADRLDPPGYRVSVECKEDVAVLAEPTLFEQALENLVVNALRHGAGPVVLRGDRALDERATITISDSGPGLPPDVLERISRAGAPLSDHAYSGAIGLGLSVAIQIVQVLGGELRAASGPAGSTLELELPAARRLRR